MTTGFHHWDAAAGIHIQWYPDRRSGREFQAVKGVAGNVFFSHYASFALGFSVTGSLTRMI
jgi:hypothetical protein